MDGIGRSPLFLAIIAIAAAIEIGWRLAGGRGYDRREALTSLGIAAGRLPLAVLNAVAIGAAFTAAWSIAPCKLPLADWRVWAAGFVAVEFAYYWAHRLSHRLRWMWATHSVHHSAQELTLLAGLRLGWTNLLSGAWLCYLPLMLLGFHPAMVAILLVASLRYQFLLHTEARIPLGPLEWILNSPSHHRVHHGANPAYLDRNFGGVLILFDRLFGTFAAERPDEPVRFGIAGRDPEPNPVRLALREWRLLAGDMRRSGSIRAALATAWSRP